MIYCHKVEVILNMLIRLIRFLCKSEYFKNFFIPSDINEWNKLDSDIHSSALYNIFRNKLLKFIGPVQRKTFNINDSKGIKLLTSLWLGFSHLRGHKFRHGFRDLLNLLCSWSTETETTPHYFLRCHFFNSNRSFLINDFSEIDSSLPTLNDNKFVNLILYDSDKFDGKKNHNILMFTIKLIKDLTTTCYNDLSINLKRIWVLFMRIF